MKLRTLLFIAGICSTTGAFGSITVTPPSPTAAETITIRLETHFGGLAHVTSASIVQVGNTFVIQQNVDDSGCLLPLPSDLISEFQVGPLASGTYSVTATTTMTDSPPCNSPIVTQQTAGFAVGSAVPALNEGALMLLALALAGMSVRLLRH
jgi:hypothetical protein